MESRFLILPSLQASVLALTFESIYDEDDPFMEFVDVDEVFLALIGGDQYPHIFALIERSCKENVQDYLEAINLSDYLEIMREEAEKLEYFEICHNCVNFRNELEKILDATEQHYSSDGCDLLECDH